ncbi:hypothetical protein BpHYR1_042069 [Brachionus plicatilis]|uniref:Uncharacterized protein n=1 Tax=Brachionus plicatilis TaxID=10195 RepID=A0A3M7SIP8_BRAPC|nr:hypothetical protein BpHYR1_042069 [Brachionus plicatilis]
MALNLFLCIFIQSVSKKSKIQDETQGSSGNYPITDTTSVMTLEMKTLGGVARLKVGYLLRNTDVESESGMSYHNHI